MTPPKGGTDVHGLCCFRVTAHCMRCGSGDLCVIRLPVIPKLTGRMSGQLGNTLVFLMGVGGVSAGDSSSSDERLGRPSYQTCFPPVKFRLEIYQTPFSSPPFLGHALLPPAQLCSFQGDRMLLTPHLGADDRVTSLGQGDHKTLQPKR